ncbi:peroxide stress protein YaaA [Microbacterium laevaniformans]|uniref:peroxide stress protein YaaA n=1 Tax=Microbacterium laevaniformans TaxID=36807 RepID=UPI00363C0FDC
MLILLPPSETKRPGGRPRAVDIAGFALPELRAARESAVDALVALSADEERAAHVLKLSRRQREDIAHNATLRSAPTLPAVDRYTGVLFDALDAATLTAASRRWLGAHVLIHSAPFGPVSALDAIPTYRLAAGTALPGIPPLRRHWAGEVTEALRTAAPSFVLDLRSEAYVALGPVPSDVASAYVRVVTIGEDGATRALNHFNKHGKGALVRRLAETRPRIATREALLAWAETAGVTLQDGAPGEIDLVV